ncbi:hypothetical protein NB689_002765 [Xanthomonas sacchari]|nr:hypothetical protein [Xanthomonas sacchari]
MDDEADHVDGLAAGGGLGVQRHARHGAGRGAAAVACAVSGSRRAAARPAAAGVGERRAGCHGVGDLRPPVGQRTCRCRRPLACHVQAGRRGRSLRHDGARGTGAPGRARCAGGRCVAVFRAVEHGAAGVARAGCEPRTGRGRRAQHPSVHRAQDRGGRAAGCVPCCGRVATRGTGHGAGVFGRVLLLRAGAAEDGQGADGADPGGLGRCADRGLDQRRRAACAGWHGRGARCAGAVCHRPHRGERAMGSALAAMVDHARRCQAGRYAMAIRC